MGTKRWFTAGTIKAKTISSRKHAVTITYRASGTAAGRPAPRTRRRARCVPRRTGKIRDQRPRQRAPHDMAGRLEPAAWIRAL